MRSHVIFVKSCYGVSFGTFEHILHIVLVFLLLTLKMRMPAGQYFFYVYFLGRLKQISGDQMNIADTTYCYLSFGIIGLTHLQNIVSKKWTSQSYWRK